MAGQKPAPAQSAFGKRLAKSRALPVPLGTPLGSGTLALRYWESQSAGGRAPPARGSCHCLVEAEYFCEEAFARRPGILAAVGLASSTLPLSPEIWSLKKLTVWWEKRWRHRLDTPNSPSQVCNLKKLTVWWEKAP